MKILVIQQKMIGDVLTSSILFELLREKHPHAELHYLINSHTFSVVEHNLHIDRFVFFTPKIEKSKLQFFHFLKSIRKEKYDIVIDVYSKASSNLVTLFSGAKIKVSKHKWYTSFIYTRTFIDTKKPKTIAGLAIENRLQLLKPILESEPSIIQPKIYLSKDEIKESKHFLEKNKIDFSKPIFMISVLGSEVSKTYPFEYMAKLIDTLVETRPDAQILFNYIPKQIKDAKAVYDFCKSETKKRIFFNVFGETLRAFMAITKHCDALIGNEGGAVNIAKALDVPTFTIFSPWITKAAWSMFEDGKKHNSIHLNDLKPKLYEGKTNKEVKANYKKYYQEFTPELIVDKFKAFVMAKPSS